MSTNKHWRHAINAWNGELPYEYAHLPLAVMMSIREELQKLNRTLGCPNVARGFKALQRIARQDEAAFKRRVEAAVRKRAKRQA